MKRAGLLGGLTGAALMVGALLVALPTPYRERKFLLSAGGCHLETLVIEPRDAQPAGTVLLLHGLAANKEIMSYLARGFASQNLRVFVPDLPGHGRSPGPFSPQRSEACSEALVHEVFARGFATPPSTVLAGHSMGGAIALRIAARVPVAGVIAISPAPMRPDHGAMPEALLFGEPPATMRHALVLGGGWELQSMRENARDLVASKDAGSRFEVIPRATHVSLIFDSRAVRSAQQWATQSLELPWRGELPPKRGLLASLAGFAGLLLITGPFLRETLGSRTKDDGQSPRVRPFPQAVMETAAASLAAVITLHWWNPLRALRLFEGDYLAGFCLLTGAVLLALHWKELRGAFDAKPAQIFGAVFAGLALFLLFSGWIELTFSEAWLNSARWWRFPLFFLAAVPYHVAEELLVGPPLEGKGSRRLGKGMLLRAVLWLALAGGLFLLGSGEVLMILLGPYFLLLFLLQRRAMDTVRKGTGSVAAAAIFGAILLSGFCLVIFPVT